MSKYKTVVEDIRENLKSLMTGGEANAAQVNQWDGEWYYVPFNGQKVDLGRTRAEAVETIQAMAEEREAAKYEPVPHFDDVDDVHEDRGWLGYADRMTMQTDGWS